MMKPICAPCRRFFRPKKNGVFFIEGAPTYNNAPVGLGEPESWGPYKLWMGDLWECPDCHAEIIVGAGLGPVAERYMPQFDELVKKYKPIYQINDC